jgi:hypothetical protein
MPDDEDPYRTTILHGPFAGPQFFDGDTPIEGIKGPLVIYDPETGEQTVLWTGPIPERKKTPGS